MIGRVRRFELLRSNTRFDLLQKKVPVHHFGRRTRGLKKLRVSKIGKIGKILQFDLISQRDKPRFFLSYRSYQAAHTDRVLCERVHDLAAS